MKSTTIKELRDLSVKSWNTDVESLKNFLREKEMLDTDLSVILDEPYYLCQTGGINFNEEKQIKLYDSLEEIFYKGLETETITDVYNLEIEETFEVFVKAKTKIRARLTIGDIPSVTGPRPHVIKDTVILTSFLKDIQIEQYALSEYYF